jgi:hypothetical protein
MSRINLSRVVATSRDFIREMTRHAEQYDDLGDEACLSGVEVIQAGQRLSLALQGRDTVFDPPPEIGSNPGIRVFYGHESAVQIQLSVILNTLRKLLLWLGCRDPHGIGLAHGFPLLGDITLHDVKGWPDLEALRRATDHLEELADRITPSPIRSETPGARLITSESDRRTEATDRSVHPAGPRQESAEAPSEAKGTRGSQEHRRGRKRKELTSLENEVWTLYEKHEGEWGAYHEIVGILKPHFDGLDSGKVERIVRKIKARQDRDTKNIAGFRHEIPCQEAMNS